jgi:pimeloyl-ACP methyl ester carboxylesterase
MPTPVVLLPGLLCDALLWAHQVRDLGDQADCWIADPTRADTIAGMAADALRDCPHETFALAGLSMGGYVALEMLRQAPARITHLALLDTSARADTPEQSKRRDDLIAMSERGRFMGVTDTLLPVLIHKSRLEDQPLVATVKAMARNVGRDAFVREQRAIQSRPDSRPHLGAIQCPTLILCGRDDMLTPLALHEELARAIPQATLVVIESCGHLSTLERPEQASAALAAWLAGRTPPGRARP